VRICWEIDAPNLGTNFLCGFLPTLLSMDSFTPILMWETNSLQGNSNLYSQLNLIQHEITLTLFMWLSYHDTTTLHGNLAISYLRPRRRTPLFIELHGPYGVAMCPPSTLFYISRVFYIFILSYTYLFSREFYAYTSP